ncbi:MAG: transglutaminase family protein [Hymenobacter sp.]
MLQRVMETKRGNPLSLCVIYLLVAQRLDLPVFGVNLPNLFVLTFLAPRRLTMRPCCRSTSTATTGA